MHFFSGQFSPRIAYIMVIASSAIWGLLWLPLRTIESFGVSPLWVNIVFMLLPAIPLALFGWRVLLADRKYWRAVIPMCLFLGGGFVLYSLGLIYGSVSKTTVLFYLTPIWATVFGLFVLGEKSSLRRWVAIGLALTGCLLVMRVNPLDITFARVDMLGLASGLCWGAGSVLIRRFPQVHFVTVTFGQYIAGASVAWIAAVLIGEAAPPAMVLIKALAFAFVIAAGLFLPTVLIILRISQYVSPGLVGILMLSEAVVAVASSWLMLNETLNLWQWMGVTLILAVGVWLGLTASEDQEASGVVSNGDRI